MKRATAALFRKAFAELAELYQSNADNAHARQIHSAVNHATHLLSIAPHQPEVLDTVAWPTEENSK